MTGPLRPTPTGISLTLHVQPGAARTEVAGIHGDAVKLRVAAPPVDGAANAAVIAFLSETLGVARRAIRLVAGGSARRKLVAVDGIGVEAAIAALGIGNWELGKGEKQ